jgi:hypothetical protein
MKKLVGITMGLVLNVPAVAAEVYKWTDALGQVHFGDRPPAGVQAMQKELRPAMGDDPGQTRGLRSGERTRLREIEKQEREEAAKQREREQQVAAESRQRARQLEQDARRCADYRQKISEYRSRLRAGCRIATCNAYNSQLDTYRTRAARACR